MADLLIKSWSIDINSCYIWRAYDSLRMVERFYNHIPYDSWTYTLYLAIQNNRYDVMRCLIDKGIKPICEDHYVLGSKYYQTLISKKHT
jgi:hypothetical protein